MAILFTRCSLQKPPLLNYKSDTGLDAVNLHASDTHSISIRAKGGVMQLFFVAGMPECDSVSIGRGFLR